MKKSFFIKIGLLLLLLPTISFAQVDVSGNFSTELNMEVTPSYIRPSEPVRINLTMYTESLDSANITWYQDGKKVWGGQGETSYSFIAGPAGFETKIEAQITLLNGASFSKSISLNPAGVDIVWEADSYTPPFYQGKALHSYQDTLKLVAMPEFIKSGKRVSPQNLVYQWSNKNQVYQSQSGYGKNTLILKGSLLGKNEYIELLVTDPTNNLVAQKFVNIAPTDPKLLFYRNDPYYGYIFENAILGSYELKTPEVQILAVPYNLSKESADNLKYEWRLNGKLVSELSNSRTAIFKKPEDEGGQSNLFLRVENLNRILQQAEANLVIRFEK